MDVIITGWESEGLRCPDFDIDLKDNEKSIALLQMPNGTGKTTTLSLLKQCFVVRKILTDDITNYRKKGTNNKEGNFTLNLNIDDKDMSIRIKLDFVNEKITHQTSGQHCGGQAPGLKLPPPLDTLIDEQFIELLFFDLEFAHELFETHSIEAANSIGRLTKSHFLKGVVKDFQGYLKKERDKKRQKKSGIKTAEKNKLDRALLKRINKKEEINKKLAENEIWFKKNDKKIAFLQKQIQDYFNRSEAIKAKIKDAEQKEEKAKQEYKNYLATQFENIKNIPNISQNLYSIYKNFYDILDKLKLPQAEAEQFFDELVKDGTECICGTPLTEEMRKKIMENKKIFLSSEETGVLNSIKKRINKIDKNNNLNLEEIKKNIGKYKADWDIAADYEKRVQAEELQDKSMNVVHETLKSLEKTQTERKEFKLETELPYNKDDDEKTGSIKSLNKQIAEIQEKLAGITHTLDMTKKIAKIKNILEFVEKESTIRIGKELVEVCNKKITDGLREDPLYIEKIENSIKLIGEQKKGSVGQQARIGYIFLTSLLERTAFKFPLVVDSPVTGMDGQGREMTAKYICSLKGQYIAFMLDTEKSNFTNILENERNNKVTHVTAYRKTKNTEFWDDQAKPYLNNFNNKSDGIVVKNKDFFYSFKLTEDIDTN